MGAKFYRGSDKSKKIRKRLSQTRTWFKQFKWIACKYTIKLISRNDMSAKTPLHILRHNFFSFWLITNCSRLLLFDRSRSSHVRDRPPLQGSDGLLYWTARPPRPQAFPDQHALPLLSSQPHQGHGCLRRRCLHPILRLLLLRLLRWLHLPAQRLSLR